MAIQVRLLSYGVFKEFLDQLPDEAFADARKAFVDIVGGKAYPAVRARASGKGVQRRTGELYDSIGWKVSGTDLSTLRASISTNNRYAKVQEEGATIRAKNKYLWLRGGPYMSFPTTINYSRGRAIRSARELFSMKARVQNGSRGFGIYLDDVKMMHLAKKVKVPARLRMRETAIDYFPQLLSRLEEIYLANTR
jgi:hypothetical protein